MNDYYLSTDLDDSYIYIASMTNQSINHTWMIRFDDRFYADKVLKKLTANLIKNPDDKNHLYEFLKKINHPQLGELFIYGMSEKLRSQIT